MSIVDNVVVVAYVADTVAVVVVVAAAAVDSVTAVVVAVATVVAATAAAVVAVAAVVVFVAAGANKVDQTGEPSGWAVTRLTVVDDCWMFDNFVAVQRCYTDYSDHRSMCQLDWTADCPLASEAPQPLEWKHREGQSSGLTVDSICLVLVPVAVVVICLLMRWQL